MDADDAGNGGRWQLSRKVIAALGPSPSTYANAPTFFQWLKPHNKDNVLASWIPLACKNSIGQLLNATVLLNDVALARLIPNEALSGRGICRATIEQHQQIGLTVIGSARLRPGKWGEVPTEMFFYLHTRPSCHAAAVYCAKELGVSLCGQSMLVIKSMTAAEAAVIDRGEVALRPWARRLAGH